MTIEQTIEVPANRRVTLEIPPQIPIGPVVLTFTPFSGTLQEAGEAAVNTTDECPICTGYRDPETGNPRYNAETAAAIEEGMAISRGEIPAKRFSSLAEMVKDLERDDPDD